MRDTQSEAETQAEAEGEAGSMQGAQCGTRSPVSRIKPWAEGRCPTPEPPRHTCNYFFLNSFSSVLVLLCFAYRGYLGFKDASVYGFLI